MDRLPPSAWDVNVLRLTLFPAPIQIGGHGNWWQTLVGEPPLKVMSEPRIGSYQATGPFRQATLILNIDLQRIEWVLTPSESELGSFPRILSGFEEGIELFYNIANAWYDSGIAPPVVRLAFGAVLFAPVESHADGYSRLSAYLPFELDPEHSSDFLYQINRRRASQTGIGGLIINRLTRWSVATTGQVHFRLSPRSGESIQQHSPPIYACHLELDINTDPEFEGELSAAQQESVLKELVALGREIAQEGDIP